MVFYKESNTLRYNYPVLNKNLHSQFNQTCTPSLGKRFDHFSNIRSINRIGPHNQEIISVIVGSLLGDVYASNRSGDGVRICYR